MNDRIIKLVGNEYFNIIKQQKILLVGLGGVGSFSFESLVRTGFTNITIVDYDIIEETNINRQLLASNNTIGNKKTDIAYNKARDINKDIIINKIDLYLDKDNINNLDTTYDYIIDACDNIETKKELVMFANKHNIKIICSMGMGNRLDGSKVEVSTLKKTINDPLAKKFRHLLKQDNISLNIPVVFSSELPAKKSGVYSIITPPGIAGLLITNYIINDLIKN